MDDSSYFRFDDVMLEEAYTAKLEIPWVINNSRGVNAFRVKMDTNSWADIN